MNIHSVSFCTSQLQQEGCRGKPTRTQTCCRNARPFSVLRGRVHLPGIPSTILSPTATPCIWPVSVLLTFGQCASSQFTQFPQTGHVPSSKQHGLGALQGCAFLLPVPGWPALPCWLGDGGSCRKHPDLNSDPALRAAQPQDLRVVHGTAHCSVVPVGCT